MSRGDRNEGKLESTYLVLDRGVVRSSESNHHFVREQCDGLAPQTKTQLDVELFLHHLHRKQQKRQKQSKAGQVVKQESIRSINGIPSGR